MTKPKTREEMIVDELKEMNLRHTREKMEDKKKKQGKHNGRKI